MISTIRRFNSDPNVHGIMISTKVSYSISLLCRHISLHILFSTELFFMNNTVLTLWSSLIFDYLFILNKVGGLGLTLSSAQVVIFAEHDWNPQVDLQAMDRAHRIGQVHPLSVYRLYSENTVEEKMLNIQKRKTEIAETVVNKV